MISYARQYDLKTMIYYFEENKIEFHREKMQQALLAV
jgi:hypothetical protein